MVWPPKSFLIEGDKSGRVWETKGFPFYSTGRIYLALPKRWQTPKVDFAKAKLLIMPRKTDEFQGGNAAGMYRFILLL